MPIHLTDETSAALRRRTVRGASTWLDYCKRQPCLALRSEHFRLRAAVYANRPQAPVCSRFFEGRLFDMDKGQLQNKIRGSLRPHSEAQASPARTAAPVQAGSRCASLADRLKPTWSAFPRTDPHLGVTTVIATHGHSHSCSGNSLLCCCPCERRNSPVQLELGALIDAQVCPCEITLGTAPKQVWSAGRSVDGLRLPWPCK